MIKSLLFYFFLPSLLLASKPEICLENSACYVGKWANTQNGTTYASFQGIRYAQPPVGTLRFKPPLPYIATEGVHDVSGIAPWKCPQFNPLHWVTGEEDCLLLNIFVPASAFDNINVSLPVMVWIHGGSFIFGSNQPSSFGPSHFMDRDVIVVLVNYRLGPLGFLSLGTEDVPGNAGLRDQTMAFQWVNENIASFGGDPSRITIFGESAGSLSVGLHLLSPLSEGLFQRAIMESNDVIDPAWKAITMKNALTYAEMFIKVFNCDESDDVLICLQSQKMEDILHNSNLVNLNDNYIWMPVIEDTIIENSFLPDDPEKLLKSGEFNKNVEVILGSNEDEGILMVLNELRDPSLWENYRNNFGILGPTYLFAIVNEVDITEHDVDKALQLMEYYIGSVDNFDSEHQQGAFDMFTDAGWLFGIHKMVNYLANHEVKVFQYILTYQGQYSLTQFYGLDAVGVCHGDDLFYIWESLPLNEQDLAVSKTMADAWTNFAKYGDPTPDSKLSWTPVEAGMSDTIQFWNISGPEPYMQTNSKLQERMDLWKHVMGNEL